MSPPSSGSQGNDISKQPFCASCWSISCNTVQSWRQRPMFFRNVRWLNGVLSQTIEIFQGGFLPWQVSLSAYKRCFPWSLWVQLQHPWPCSVSHRPTVLQLCTILSLPNRNLNGDFVCCTTLINKMLYNIYMTISLIPAVATLCFYFLNTPHSLSSRHVWAPPGPSSGESQTFSSYATAGIRLIVIYIYIYIYIYC
jgi:hypothetical protein